MRKTEKQIAGVFSAAAAAVGGAVAYTAGIAAGAKGLALAAPVAAGAALYGFATYGACVVADDAAQWLHNRQSTAVDKVVEEVIIDVMAKQGA